MAKHTQHSQPDLVDALEHVVYEIWKYRQAIADYEAIQRVGGDAALEFRILHQRVLLEFFYGPPKHQDNIVAWEYIADWQQTHPSASLVWLDDYMTRCHTMLAHISTNRFKLAKQGRKDWIREWLVVEPLLDQTIADFLGSLSTDYKSICLRWINQWLDPGYSRNETLNDLPSMINLP